MKTRASRFAWLAAWLHRHGVADVDSTILSEAYRKATGATEKHLRRDLGQMTREGIASRVVVKTGDPYGPAWIYRYSLAEQKP